MGNDEKQDIFGLGRPLRIFNYPWHLAHQYELCKIQGTQWSWLIQHRRNYNKGPRGDFIEKFGINLVPHYEKGKYDIAILHLDQQCLEEALWERGKGSVYREVNEVIKDIPKVVIMHGTPYYPEMFPSDITEENCKELGYTKKQVGMSSKLIQLFKEKVGDNYVVFNSYRAKEEWDFENNPKAITIWHGMDADEWLDLPKEPRIITTLSPAGLDAYYDRSFLRQFRETLLERNIKHCHITSDAVFKNWDEYRTFIGRSLLYFHPMKEAPMSRGRTEAMLSGCCVLTTPWHDTERFIKDGENGFIIKRDVEKTCDLVEELFSDYDRAIKVGQAGKETALQLFSGERYRLDWINWLKNIIK